MKFRGLSPKLPLRRDFEDGYSMNKNYREMVKQNVKMLLLTAPGERIMDPEFGIGLQTFLFENSLIIDSVYYVFNGGNLVAGIDQWDGEWFEVSLDSTNLTTGSANLNVNNNGNNNGGGPSNNNTNTSNNSGRINDIVPTGFGHR